MLHLALRSLAFQALFYAWTTVCAVAFLPALALPRRAIVALGRIWSRGIRLLLATVCGLRDEVRGGPAGAGPALYAIKHQSAWETLMIVLLLPDPAVVLKRELYWIPFFGWYVRKLRMIPVDRAAGAAALRRMVAAARAEIAAGRPVVVFPEGTRRPVDASPAYQPGVAALYAALGVPAVPVALNSGLFWARRAVTRRPGTVTVSFLPAIAPGLGRAAFMAALEGAIEPESRKLAEAGRRTIEEH